MDRVSMETFKDAVELGAKSITCAPGGTYGLMPCEAGVAILLFDAPDSGRVLEFAPGMADAEDRVRALSAEGFFDYLEKAPSFAHPETRRLTEAADFSVWHTGGGCLAYGRMDGDDEILLVDAEGGIRGAPESEEWSVGRYRDDGAWFSVGGYRLDEAIQVAERLPSVERLEQSGLQVDRHYEPDEFAPHLT